MKNTRFQTFIWKFYRDHGRTLPWRTHITPYRILVSEIMLQQTQVDRVVPKFNSFIRQFPNFKALAAASVADVLKAWQGLGYNRRGLALQRIAYTVITQYGGRLPKSREALEALPGIGPYTAGAILIFAYDQPEVCIETNIRRVFIHHFFADQLRIHDKDVQLLVAKHLDRGRPREWYYALMDYGASLPKLVKNPNRRSAHYTRQSKFEGSHRQLRGRVLKALLQEPLLTNRKLAASIGNTIAEIRRVKTELIQEGLVVVD